MNYAQHAYRGLSYSEEADLGYETGYDEGFNEGHSRGYDEACHDFDAQLREYEAKIEVLERNLQTLTGATKC